MYQQEGQRPGSSRSPNNMRAPAGAPGFMDQMGRSPHNLELSHAGSENSLAGGSRRGRAGRRRDPGLKTTDLKSPPPRYQKVQSDQHFGQSSRSPPKMGKKSPKDQIKGNKPPLTQIFSDQSIKVEKVSPMRNAESQQMIKTQNDL